MVVGCKTPRARQRDGNVAMTRTLGHIRDNETHKADPYLMGAVFAVYEWFKAPDGCVRIGEHFECSVKNENE